jgi:hypothetical protein
MNRTEEEGRVRTNEDIYKGNKVEERKGRGRILK